VDDARQSLLAQVPAQLEAAVGQDRGVDDRDVGTVGRSTQGDRGRSPDAQALDGRVALEAVDQGRFGLEDDR
jgi:hypothetical protein